MSLGRVNNPNQGSGDAAGRRRQIAAYRHRDHQRIKREVPRVRRRVDGPAEWFGVIRRASDEAPNDAEHDQPKDSHADGLMDEQDFRTKLAAWKKRCPDAERKGDKNERCHQPMNRAQPGIVDPDRARRRKRFHGLEPARRLRPDSPRESDNLKAEILGIVHASMIATARVQPAEARSILTGKQTTVKPVDGSASRLCSFSIWQ